MPGSRKYRYFPFGSFNSYVHYFSSLFQSHQRGFTCASSDKNPMNPLRDYISKKFLVFSFGVKYCYSRWYNPWKLFYFFHFYLLTISYLFVFIIWQDNNITGMYLPELVSKSQCYLSCRYYPCTMHRSNPPWLKFL
ncbi:hypothetical protein ES703_31572 [subsurface metagenome]